MRPTSSSLALTSFVSPYPGVRTRYVGRRQLMTRFQPSPAARDVPPSPPCSAVAVSWNLALTGMQGSGWWDWPIVWVTSVAAISCPTTQCFMGVR
jgi:hypothetical protein